MSRYKDSKNSIEHGPAEVMSGLAFLLVVAVLAVVLITWRPWNGEESSVPRPGQGGSDEPPAGITETLPAIRLADTPTPFPLTPVPTVTPILRR